mmetsp:Transcript_42418/g.124226  ORF Transcript_42418/g.124226 Transcript_42418/m.124226 type:complete len:771 (+) Transcript_42418:1-2313(+)
MHCSPKQQRMLTGTLVEQLGVGTLVPFAELESKYTVVAPSPNDLHDRVIAKGKIKHLRASPAAPARSVGSSKRHSIISRAGNSFKGSCRALGQGQSGNAAKGSQPVGQPNSRRTQALAGALAAAFSQGSRSQRTNTSCSPTTYDDEALGRFSETSEVADEDEVETMMHARRKLYGNKGSSKRQGSNSGSKANITDEYYAAFLGIRSASLRAFLSFQGSKPPAWPLTITSVNEDRMLMELGVSERDRKRIEGLQATSSSRRNVKMSEEQLAMNAIAQLAANPPAQVASVQRRTAGWLVRPYPLGLRISGRNVSPLPFWLAGSQSVALNMSNNDLAVQLHFALFDSTGGYKLKPCEMLNRKDARSRMESSRGDTGCTESRQGTICSAEGGGPTAAPAPASDHGAPAEAPDAISRRKSDAKCWAFLRALNNDDEEQQQPPSQQQNEQQQSNQQQNGQQLNDLQSWPPLREQLQRISIDLLSLHQLPKRGEQRPRYDGTRGECHKYHRELSGFFMAPDNTDASCPSVTLAVHPIGGFCAIAKKLPMRQAVEREATTPTVHNNGLSVPVRQTMHCLAAEPHATFLRISVTDGGQEIAYESVVLGRLRHGYRIFQLRSLLGTRIELCFLLVRIHFGSEANLWVRDPQQQQRQVGALQRRLEELEAALAHSSSAALVSPVCQSSREYRQCTVSVDGARCESRKASCALPMELLQAGEQSPFMRGSVVRRESIPLALRPSTLGESSPVRHSVQRKASMNSSMAADSAAQEGLHTEQTV